MVERVALQSTPKKLYSVHLSAQIFPIIDFCEYFRGYLCPLYTVIFQNNDMNNVNAAISYSMDIIFIFFYTIKSPHNLLKSAKLRGDLV